MSYKKLPFDEAILFFIKKVNIPTEAWNDVWKAQHNHAFMIAGAMRADLLAGFHASILKALTEGTTIEDFRDDFDSLVESSGWDYNGGRNWRTKIIFETNIIQSYNAGREQQMADPELQAARPYAVYKHGDSANPRELHLSWNNIVLLHAHVWWVTHSPSNGWGCTCKKFAVDESYLIQHGLTVTEPPDNGTYVWEDKKTGEVHVIPNGISAGFDYRPETDRTAQLKEQFLAKAEKLPAPLNDYLKDDLNSIKDDKK